MMFLVSLFEISEYSSRWLDVLFAASVKGFMVLAIAAGLNLVLRRSSSALRHLIWLLAITSCLCLPVISLILPSWQLPVVPQMHNLPDATPGVEKNLDGSALPLSEHRSIAPQVSNPDIHQNQEPARLRNAGQGASDTSDVQASGWWAMPALWTGIGIAWFIGMLFVLVPMLAGLVGIWRIARRSQRVTEGSLAALMNEIGQELGLNRRVSLLRSEAKMPLTWGVFRPQVLVPADAENWASDRQRAVLLHELAHVQRWDWLTQTLAHISCAIYWFNPLVWMADRHMRLERERACDDHVLTAGYRATDYAEHLLEIARKSRLSYSTARAAVAMAQPSWIEKRLLVILAADRNRRPVTRAAVFVGVFTLACLVLPIGILRLAEAVEDQELLQQIREAILWRPEPSESTPTDGEMAVMMEQMTKRIENALELSERFLSTYPESEKRDEAWRYKINSLLALRRQEEANIEMDTFLQAFPKSKYALEIMTVKVQLLGAEGKFEEALAALDKIDDPVILPKVYEQKAGLYSMMRDHEKVAEYRLRAAELSLGRPAPDFSLKDINGENVSLKDFRGKVVLLDFWATWCGPCIHELPNLKALYDKHKDNPAFALIGISSDVNDETVAKFVANNEMPWIHIRETEEMQAKYNVIGIPHYTVIDKNGLIRDENLRGGIELSSAVASLLAEAAGEPNQTHNAKLHKLRADLHDSRGEREQAITEYEHVLRLQPNDIRSIFRLIDLYSVDQSEKAFALYDRALAQLIEANRSKSQSDSMLGGWALHLAGYFGNLGNIEKCWQAFEIVMENNPHGSLAKEAEWMSDSLSVISDRPAFKAFTDAAPETEYDRRQKEMDRKRAEFASEMSEAWKSYLAVEADGTMFTGVILTSVGHILVLEDAADANDIAANVAAPTAQDFNYLPARVVARDSKARLAVIKVEGANNLRPVELGTVDDLKEHAPYDYAAAGGHTGRSFGGISKMTARDAWGEGPVGHITRTGLGVHVLEIDEAGNIGKLLIENRGKSPLSDAFIHYDGSLLGICVDDEVVYTGDIGRNAPGPKNSILTIDQIQASLERMGVTKLIEIDRSPVAD